MKRICRQAASSGCCCRVVDWAWPKRPRPAQSSPSMGVSGQPAVNHAGAATVAPPRVRRDRPSQKPRTPSYFSLTQ